MASVGHLVKESLVAELTSDLAERPNVFVTTLNRLTAPEADVFRQKLFGSHARLILVKRRLGRRAVEHLKVPGLAEWFEGSVALVLADEDALSTAKVLIEFVKAHEEQVAVRGALIDGQLLDKMRVRELASLPSTPILLAQVASTIESPLAEVIVTLERLIGELAWIAEQAAATRPAETPSPQAQAESTAPSPETPTASPPVDPSTQPEEGPA
jgi:large subunit ribosomal protein L10